jgi:hypothetical protein
MKFKLNITENQQINESGKFISNISKKGLNSDNLDEFNKAKSGGTLFDNKKSIVFSTGTKIEYALVNSAGDLYIAVVNTNTGDTDSITLDSSIVAKLKSII